MASVALLSVTLLAVTGQVLGQDDSGGTSTYPATPLAQKTFAYNDIPYKVDTDVGLIRGTQFGYNQCNETTAGQDALCQTAIFNSIDDFCLWGPDEPDIIANTEGEEVAYCTKDHGARLIPEGTITGLQLIETDEYLQLTGFIKGPNINIKEGDFGGELDPHGADLRGNPMGGLIYSNHWTGQLDQIFEWHQFIGADGFCFRICKPTSDQDAAFCQHIYDRIGCAYNDPSDAKDGEFSVCKGDVGLPPGIYIENGATMTYEQPPESLGEITSVPYTATVPPHSECTTYASTELFAALQSVTPSGASGSSEPTGSSGASSTRSHSGTSTGSSAESTESPDSATTTTVIGFSSLVGVLFIGLFL